MLEVKRHGKDTEWMRKALHDLCQALTALESRLFLGTMDDGGRIATADGMRQTIIDSLKECERLMAHVRAMQDRLQ